VNPPWLGLIVCGAVELLVMSTVPPHVTLSDAGENAYDVPLSTIDSDVDDVLFGHAVGAVGVGLGVGFGLVATGFGAVECELITATGEACVAVALGFGADDRRTADGEGAGDVGTPLALATGLAEGPASRPLLPPPPHAARASADRARVTGSRRSDISPSTQRRLDRFSSR